MHLFSVCIIQLFQLCTIEMEGMGMFFDQGCLRKAQFLKHDGKFVSAKAQPGPS